MSWFVYALICVMGWGLADLFYKKGSDAEDRYSHLKIAVWVGLVMGVAAFAMMPFAETEFTLPSLGSAALAYSPASLCYIISMVIGYAGLRYLELSIISPVQNASGAFSALLMVLYFAWKGKMADLSEELSALDLIGTALIVCGMVALAVVEQRLSRQESGLPAEERKYRYGALALLFPILYCVFDTAGTAADGIILDGETGLGIGEIDVLVLYGLTFLLAGVVCWVALWVLEKKPYNPFARSEKDKAIAALCEEFGQVFYVYAMAQQPVLAAPMVASYCVVSALLSRIFLKEKLTKGQYACILLVIAGIVIMGVSEGLAEA